MERARCLCVAAVARVIPSGAVSVRCWSVALVSQGEMVDKIHTNITTTHDNVKKGNHHLAKVSRSADQSVDLSIGFSRAYVPASSM